MENKILTNRFFFVVAIIIAAAFARLIPHWPNFTPVAAIALFGGTYIGKKYMAFIIPLAAMFISDLVIGFHTTMLPVYLAISFTVFLGFALRRKTNVMNIALASLASSAIFFLVTNFGAWLTMPFYPKTVAGLVQAYVAGLAFFHDGSQGISFFMNSLLGTLSFTALFFGIYAIAKAKAPRLIAA